MAPLASADEVTDAIQEGIKYYENRQYPEAAGSLDYAAQLIRQKRGGDLQSFLPKPLEGWSAEEATSQAMGAPMFGGGVSAERRYHQGDKSVTVSIVTDSPLMQGMMMMVANPMLATSGGAKLQTIKGQRAVVEFAPSATEGSVKIAVANRFLVSIEGNGVVLQDLVDYAGAFDYPALAAMQ